MNGDSHAEGYIWEKCHENTAVVGDRYLNGESDFEYGSRVGAWRILRLFKEFGYPFTLYGVAEAVAKNPAFGKACVREGCEIGNHALRWTGANPDRSMEEELEEIKKAILLLKEVTGEAPVGAYLGRIRPFTPALVAQAHKDLGIPLLWNSDCYNDDVPYWVDLPQEKNLPKEERTGMLMVPYCYTTNDYKFVSSYPGPGFSGAFAYEDYLKAEFDQLYSEGGKMMNIPMHARIMGKPGRTNALRNFMKYISEKEGVWVCNRRDIASHFAEKFPYEAK